MKMRKVLIFGISGLLGSQIAVDLLKQGLCPIGVHKDIKPYSRLYLEGLADRIIFPSCDICNKEGISRIIHEYEPDCIIHLAAQPIVQKSVSNPYLTFDTNIRSTYAILDSIREIKPNIPVIIASTDKVYGDGSPPFSEDSMLNAVYPYDVSKLCVDRIALSYFKTFALNLVVIRPANIYGPGDMHRSRLIPDTILTLIEGRNPMIRSDGQYIRDFIYVEDISKACISLLKILSDKRALSSAIYNIGSGKPYRILDIVEKLIAISGKNLKPEVLSQPLKEIRKQWLNIDRIKKDIGFIPEFDIDRGLESAYRWYYNVTRDNRSIFTIP